MEKILGLDLGTNSIGLTLRNVSDKGIEISQQLEMFSSIIFPCGVGNGKTGEFSYAAERTKKRTVRRLFQARKYRIWATLELLINNGYCPLSIEDLDKWRKYDKAKGLKREYPVNNEKFEQWVRLDFNGDGVADYSSPYELRNELMTNQLDFNNETDRFKLGRALYHIAQRRGFKSSKGETLKEQVENEKDKESFEDVDFSEALKKSEEKKASALKKYMDENNFLTVGCAFYHLQQSGIRVRNSNFQAVRSQYKDEIKQIFEFQNGLDTESEFYKHLVSEKKSEGTIFYKRPLRSQKGSVGKCVLESDKNRCPVSHPDFEKFRAWCFINTIKFGKDNSETLTLEQKQKLFADKFMRTCRDFKFSEIREWIEDKTGEKLNYNNKTINYKDRTNVSGCPVSGRLKNLFGNDWRNWKYNSSEEKVNKKNGEVKKISYDIFDIWHICFSFEDVEYVSEFAEKKLHFDTKQTDQLIKIFGTIQQGYAMLCLKAIRSINRFLEKGLLYSDSVLLAKLPEIFGEEKWTEIENEVTSKIGFLTDKNRLTKRVYNIVNSLIADYKSLEIEEQFARKNTEYKLTGSDKQQVLQKIVDNFGQHIWNNQTDADKKSIVAEVEKLYQDFFASSQRDYYKLPKLSETLSQFLADNYNIESEKLANIYHPSMIDIYAKAQDQIIEDGRCLKLLDSPVIGALKNPMAMRVLHTLRKTINNLLKKTDENGNALIDEDTKIVVETARELNDSNMRWAIEEYQRERAKENKEFAKLMEEQLGIKDASDADLEKMRLFIEQYDGKLDKVPTKETKQKFERYKKDVTKYRLWIEQNCQCIYTGKIISIANLFDDNAFDIEHTIPRSKSFDDSLQNKTVCDAHFNRTVKQNKLPYELDNYSDILKRIQPWKDKVERLKENVEFWKNQSKKAQDKNRKDDCIRQRHLWQMELDYWKAKVERFEMQEVTSGFRNSQLVDTRIITKYAFHYLKTVFNKVEVQKGSVTAGFRKMLGIQSIDEKKSREKHSHHAIDAAVLTLIPTAAQRDKMLELFYKIQEGKYLGINTQNIESELKVEILKCGLRGNVSNIVPFIEDNILVNQISKDQTLTPAHRRKRVRGKIVPVKDGDNKIVFEQNEDGSYKLDKHGHPIPKAKYWITGDSLRGKLHQESFYGAIRMPKYDKNGTTLLRRKDGSIVTEDSNVYVIRRELSFKKNENDSGFKNWDELEKAIVDKNLFQTMKNQFAENTSFKDAIEQGIKDSQENNIRHIRCFTSIKNPLEIKKQTYLSKYDYKQNYYAAMGDLAVMCIYTNNIIKKSICRIWSLFEISQNRKAKTADVEDIPTIIPNKNNVPHYLSKQIRSGDMLLLYQNTPEELYEMDNAQLSQRLYVVTGFENPNYVKLVKHISAKKDSDLGKGESIKSYENMPEKIRQTITGLNILIAGKDFALNADSTITFL